MAGMVDQHPILLAGRCSDMKLIKLGGYFMKKLTGDLLTENYTQIWHEDEDVMKFGAPHHFQIVRNAPLDGELGYPAQEGLFPL